MLSKRLKSLVKYVSKTDNIIDIGCDHALLDIYLVKNNIIEKLIVSDVHKDALNCGISNIKKEGLDSKIEARLGNGLEVLNEKDNINTILISGMGTKTILEILNNPYLNKVDKLILQSNRDYDILRQEVIKLGFFIDKEEVIVDNNKLYITIVFLRGSKDITDEEIKYGTSNMINKEIYYNYLITKKNEILNRVENEELKVMLQKEIEFLKNKQ